MLLLLLAASKASGGVRSCSSQAVTRGSSWRGGGNTSLLVPVCRGGGQAERGDRRGQLSAEGAAVIVWEEGR